MHHWPDMSAIHDSSARTDFLYAGGEKFDTSEARSYVTISVCTDLRTYYVQYIQACTLTNCASCNQTLKQTAKYSLQTSKHCAGFQWSRMHSSVLHGLNYALADMASEISCELAWKMCTTWRYECSNALSEGMYARRWNDPKQLDDAPASGVYNSNRANEALGEQNCANAEFSHVLWPVLWEWHRDLPMLPPGEASSVSWRCAVLWQCHDISTQRLH